MRRPPPPGRNRAVTCASPQRRTGMQRHQGNYFAESWPAPTCRAYPARADSDAWRMRTARSVPVADCAGVDAPTCSDTSSTPAQSRSGLNSGSSYDHRYRSTSGGLKLLRCSQARFWQVKTPSPRPTMPIRRSTLVPLGRSSVVTAAGTTRSRWPTGRCRGTPGTTLIQRPAPVVAEIRAALAARTPAWAISDRRLGTILPNIRQNSPQTAIMKCADRPRTSLTVRASPTVTAVIGRQRVDQAATPDPSPRDSARNRAEPR
jgi:hypothetical protein